MLNELFGQPSGFPGGIRVKNLLANAGDQRDQGVGFDLQVRKITWSRKW